MRPPLIGARSCSWYAHAGSEYLERTGLGKYGVRPGKIFTGAPVTDDTPSADSSAGATGPAGPGAAAAPPAAGTAPASAPFAAAQPPHVPHFAHTGVAVKEDGDGNGSLSGSGANVPFYQLAHGE